MMTTEAKDKLINVLACDVCKFPILCIGDILMDKFPVWNDAVYRYELNVLEKDVMCYSATTNNAVGRYDVLRVRKNIDTVTYSQTKPSLHHTWFPGYEWTITACKACNTFLGWAFSYTNKHFPERTINPAFNTLLDEDDLDYTDHNFGEINKSVQVEFLGLILTRMTPYEYTISRLSDYANELEYYHCKATNAKLNELYRLLNDMPLRVSCVLHPLVIMMQHDPRQRAKLGDVIDSIRGLQCMITSTESIKEYSNNNQNNNQNEEYVNDEQLQECGSYDI